MKWKKWKYGSENFEVKTSDLQRSSAASPTAAAAADTLFFFFIDFLNKNSTTLRFEILLHDDSLARYFYALLLALFGKLL